MKGRGSKQILLGNWSGGPIGYCLALLQAFPELRRGRGLAPHRRVRDRVDQRAPDHDPIGRQRDLPHVLRPRNAKPDRNRKVAVPTDALHQRTDLSGYAAARAVNLGQAVSDLVMQADTNHFAMREVDGVWVASLDAATPRVSAELVEAVMQD